jgi:hypothetical protein
MDDWSYIRSAQILAHTGHLAYNGWATSIIGWQFYAGALFLKLFGGSFTAARMSTVCVALATLWVFELLLEGFGLTRRNAVFGTLTLGLSPLFLPLAASFMNDANALLPLVLCCYLCLRALKEPQDRRALGWLALAALTNAIGGTVRQTAWLPGLVILPSTVWLMRHRRYAVVTGVLLWSLVAATVLGCMLWWRQEPFAVIDKPVDLSSWLGPDALQAHGRPLLHMVMVLALICLPVLCAAVPRVRGLAPRRLVLVVAIGMVLAAGLLIDGSFRYAWMGGVGAYMLPDWQTTAWTIPAAAITCVVGIAGPLFFAVAARTHAASRPPMVAGALEWHAVRILTVPYLLAYAALMTTRPPLGIFDRYLLPVFPVVILCLLRLYQDRVAHQLPAISYAVLAVFALAAVLGTHDWFASYRAIDAAERSLIDAGVPPLSISGPPEIDGMRQLDAVGYMDEPRIAVPKGIYTPNVLQNELPAACETWLADRITAIHPKYVVRLGRFPCQADGFERITYATWLPPFERQLFIVKLRRKDP